MEHCPRSFCIDGFDFHEQQKDSFLILFCSSSNLQVHLMTNDQNHYVKIQHIFTWHYNYCTGQCTRCCTTNLWYKRRKMVFCVLHRISSMPAVAVVVCIVTYNSCVHTFTKDTVTLQQIDTLLKST